MIADIGTRRCTSLKDVNQESLWVNGYQWMSGSKEQFPTLTTEDISLNAQDVQQINKEVKEEVAENCHISSLIPDGISDRYKLSDYIIDPNRRNFSCVVRILSYAIQFIKRCQLAIKDKRNSGSDRSMVKEADNDAEMYFFRKATNEVKAFVKPSKIKDISQEQNGILYYTGRILPNDSISILGRATQAMKDLTSTSFCVPIIDRLSPIAYSIVMDVHWNHPTAKHAGIETTWRFVLQKVFIIEGRSLVKAIRNKCQRCRYMMKKTLDVSMGPLSNDNLIIAPSFYVTQADLAGPFQSFSQHHKRTTVKIWLIVFCCATTTGIKIKVMDDYGTAAFLQAFTRFSCEVGYPFKLLIDEGSQLVKGCKSMQINFTDLKNKLHQSAKINFEVCSVGGHNVNGRVERKIQEIRRSLETSVHLKRLSLLQWETMASAIANSINNLPIAVRGIKGDLEISDLLTPNRLMLGRNNDRSPTGIVEVTDDSDKIIRANKEIFSTWFECWLTSHVPNLLHQSKWFSSNESLKPGDVVLFLKQDSILSSTYQYGMVKCVLPGRDSKVRKVIVTYRNSNENVNRETTRSTRTLVVINHIDEIDMSKELYEMKY